MWWVQVSAELLLLSWHFESNEFGILTGESECPEDLLSEWIHGLLGQEIEVVRALLAVVGAEWNELWSFTALTVLTKVEHLREGRTFVGNEEQVRNIIVVRPAHLRVGVELRLNEWLAPVSWVPNHVLTIVEIIGTD